MTLLALLTLCAQQRLPPLRPPPQQQPDDAGLFARATFGTLNPTLRLGFSRPLQRLDLPPLRREDSSRLATTQLDDELAALAATGSDKPRTVPPPPPADSAGAPGSQLAASILGQVARALWRTFGTEFSVAGLLKLASDACQLASPLLLKRIVGLLEQAACPPTAAAHRLRLLLGDPRRAHRLLPPVASCSRPATPPRCAPGCARRRRCSSRRRCRRSASATTLRASSASGCAFAPRSSALPTASCSASLPQRRRQLASRLCPPPRHRLFSRLLSALTRSLPSSPPQLSASSGEVTTLVSTDAQRVADLTPYLHASQRRMPPALLDAAAPSGRPV